MKMKTKMYLASLAVVAAGFTAGPASAEHWDVLASEMTGQCTLPEYMKIVSDFNVWGTEHGYSTKIAMPLQQENMTTFFWVGTTVDAATFGAAWDAWRDAQSDPDSTPAKLQARFDKCSTTLSRSGYDVY
jgi:hypothetical protein